mgnify:FL=1
MIEWEDLMEDRNVKGTTEPQSKESELSDERRDFLKKCGKFAMYSAPAMAALLLFDRKKAHAVGGSGN